jgi:hypothetical protein
MGWLFLGVFMYKSVCTIILQFFHKSFFLNGLSAYGIAPSASITPLDTNIHIQWGMLQRTQTLQRKRRNTIGRCSMYVRMTCSIILYTRERQFMLFVCIRLFMLFKNTCTVY